jgi:hypothetical protein
MRAFRFVIIAILLLNWPARADEIRILPKEITATDNEVRASGRWVILTPFDAPLLSKLNSVEIVCKKSQGVCHEAIAALYTKEDPQVSHQFLTALISEYKVTEWNTSGIKAISPAPVADVTLQIDLKAGTASRRHQETKARGNKTSNPNVVVDWALK